MSRYVLTYGNNDAIIQLQSHIVTHMEGGEKMDADKIAARLVALRGQLSREQVAKDLNISVSAIAMYETGARIPRDEIKKRIADYFQESVDSIFFS